MSAVDAERSIAMVDVDLTRHVKDLEGRLDLFVQGVVSTLFNEVQGGGRFVRRGTPVDTGFARANWQGGLAGLTPTPAISAKAAKASPSAGRAAAAGRQRDNERVVQEMAKAGVVVELANNAPYINRLEHGFIGTDSKKRYYTGFGPKSVGGRSSQAPEGMVKVAILNAQAIVDEVAAHVMKMR